MRNPVQKKILIIDDELSSCTFLSLALKKDYFTEYATDAKKGLELLLEKQFDLVLLDMVIGNDNGLEILERIKTEKPETGVIMLTAFASIKTSVDAIRKGAFTYLSKPIELEELKLIIQQCLSVQQLSEDIVFLNDQLSKVNRYHELVGKSKPMKQVYALIEKVKDVDCNVILTGESGTGKDLAARAIHFSGKRSSERFVVINCAAIPETLLEEELFGHKKGTFTSANQDKKGKLEIANGGTVFLDEIGDMPINLQSKLLHVIQQKEFTPLGGNLAIKVDVRFIVATNRNLRQMVQEGTFREDLFYRLSVMEIKMPPLRERKEDIGILCEHFLRQYCSDQNKRIEGLSPEAKRLLRQYNYPGNVRQLANILEYAVILSADKIIQAEDLPLEIRGYGRPQQKKDDDLLASQLSGYTLKQIERIAIEAALKANGGRRDLTAGSLGISIRNLHNKIKEYGL